MKELCFLSTPYDINDNPVEEIIQLANQVLLMKGIEKKG
jgi:hypothetical protein